MRSLYFNEELTDDLSKAMVKRIENRYGAEIWPWERAGLKLSHAQTTDHAEGQCDTSIKN